MSRKPLQLEILSGPLDGYIVTLADEAAWGQDADSMLTFPWDTELGTPQARFFLDGEDWWLEGYSAEHGTYCLTQVGRIADKLQLQMGDILKASETWLRVIQIR